MLTLQDCLDMCDPGPGVVEAVARHEHLPCILAAELAETLCTTAAGRRHLHRLLVDCLADAHRRGDVERARSLEAVLADHRRRYPGSVS
ncbi:MAG: hypothetical protein AB1918_06485 [Pseudomonadota bacterium]